MVDQQEEDDDGNLGEESAEEGDLSPRSEAKSIEASEDHEDVAAQEEEPIAQEEPGANEQDSSAREAPEETVSPATTASSDSPFSNRSPEEQRLLRHQTAAMLQWLEHEAGLVKCATQMRTILAQDGVELSDQPNVTWFCIKNDDCEDNNPQKENGEVNEVSDHSESSNSDHRDDNNPSQCDHSSSEEEYEEDLEADDDDDSDHNNNNNKSKSRPKSPAPCLLIGPNTDAIEKANGEAEANSNDPCPTIGPNIRKRNIPG